MHLLQRRLKIAPMSKHTEGNQIIPHMHFETDLFIPFPLPCKFFFFIVHALNYKALQTFDNFIASFSFYCFIPCLLFKKLPPGQFTFDFLSYLPLKPPQSTG